jgi:hypothetical protein
MRDVQIADIYLHRFCGFEVVAMPFIKAWSTNCLEIDVPRRDEWGVYMCKETGMVHPIHADAVHEVQRRLLKLEANNDQSD